MTAPLSKAAPERGKKRKENSKMTTREKLEAKLEKRKANQMQDEISKAAAVMGRKGGKVSSPAKSAAAKARPNLGLAEGRKRLASLTPEQRRENAKKAARARWKK